MSTDHDAPQRDAGVGSAPGGSSSSVRGCSPGHSDACASSFTFFVLKTLILLEK